VTLSLAFAAQHQIRWADVAAITSTIRLGALVALCALGCANDDGSSRRAVAADTGAPGGAGGVSGTGNGGAGGSGAGYMCHWDCFGGASCEDGLVTAFHVGPCPCSHCTQLSDCIADTISCPGECARPFLHGGEGCVNGDVGCYAAKMCDTPDADLSDGPADAHGDGTVDSGALPDA
jgi:hypothetical protein